MKLTLTCEHGTRTVAFEEGREGIGNVQSLTGKRSFANQFISEAIPRCPYCDAYLSMVAKHPEALGVKGLKRS